MKFLNSNRVLCFSPHPDDCEYAIAGTVKKYFKTEFHIYNFSNGGKYSTEKNGDMRKNEVHRFWSSNKNVKLLFFGDSFIEDTNIDKFVYELDKILLDNKYDWLLVPPYLDTHQDHRKINLVSQSLLRSKAIGLIEYMTPSTKSDWTPNLFVDIDDYILWKKDNLFNTFKSQLDKPYFKEEVFDSFHSSFQTSKRDLNFVEFFCMKSSYLI